MLRRLRPFLFLLVLAVVAACDSESSANPLIGQQAPNVRLSPLTPGSDIELADYKGKVVILDFWATWCGPCRELMPTLVDLKKKYGEKGLVVVGVTSENAAPVRAFRRDNPEINYDFFLDGLQTATTVYHAASLPTTVIIGRDGKVAYWDAGYSPDETPQQLESAIVKALDQS
jgi:thiol-disulfide isomerase/thioredoxin